MKAMLYYHEYWKNNNNNNQSAEGADGLGITRDNKLGESE